MASALITGATGFIGTYLLHELVAAGWHCRVLVRPDRPGPDEPDVEVVQGDLTDKTSLHGIADDIDVVFHLAGVGHVAAVSDGAYARFRAINVEGVDNLIAACRPQPLRRFVHFSSTAAMGLIRAAVIDESCEPEPRTPYQHSKREGELIVLRACQNDALPGVILRPCMVYGPGGTGEFAKICRWMAKGIFPRVGRGSSLMPMIHVRDVVRGAVLAAERGRSGEAYLLVGECLPIATMRRIVLDTLNLKRPYMYVPLGVALLGAGMIEGASRLTGKPAPVSRQNVLSMATGRQFDPSKARRELGFEPEHSLAQSAGEVLDWFKKQGIV